ncbi:MAG: SGNH/GDSL hydrolase family protein [Lachnospiraceae bacterium]|nr:SGNH/GDSL hydrolase family protein [Lachnospiraceae bacterium]
MRKTVFTYLFFILAMTAFITLRVHAGKAQERTVAKTEETNPEPTAAPVVSDEKDDSGKASEETEEEDVIVPITEEEEHLYHGPVEPGSDFRGLIPRIVCWGDSLTVSIDGKSAFPDILRDLSGCEVVNYGVESENAAMIAMREGGVRVNVKATVIPSDTNLIPIFLRTENNGHVFFLDYGDGGVNPCSINGIEGELQQLNGSYYFQRKTKGERIAVEEGTQFKTFGMNDSKPDDILVIFAGTNDLPDSKSVRNLIATERAMLDAAKCEKYIIVGLTYAGGIPEIDAVNEALANEFGEHFVDIRKYMLNYGLADAGVEPSEQDKADIRKGEIPSSLRRDYVHGNKLYHRLIGEQVYRRMQYLGYVPSSNEGEEEE